MSGIEGPKKRIVNRQLCHFFRANHNRAAVAKD
jgi:hypothetical protein